jgi:hypothetical protein
MVSRWHVMSLYNACVAFFVKGIAFPRVAHLTPRTLHASFVKPSLLSCPGVGCLISSITFVFCTACSSLLGACCGNDKPSTVAPSVTSGRKRSVTLLLLSVGLSVAFQYGIGPAILNASSSASFVIGDRLRTAWSDGCTSSTAALTDVCAGNNGVFRVGFATMLFFMLAGVAAWCKPTMNREAWPAKFVLYLFLVAAMVFIPNNPLFSQVYLNLARIGGVFFIFLQQIIIIDCAHNWNDSWVSKADKAEAEEPGSGKKWLGAILLSCCILYLGAIVGLILMFIHFTGCPSNTAFIATTLLLCIVITVAQLTGEEGSLLSSGCVSAWAVYLLYNAVSKNPNGACNPLLGQSDRLSIALGIIITIMSLGWTGWSYTAEERLTETKQSSADATESLTPEVEAGEEQPATKTKKISGIVTGGTTDDDEDEDAKEADNRKGETHGDMSSSQPSLSNSWRLNVILIVVSFWTSMILTRWGDISTDGSVANLSVGNVAMWMLMASQWIVLLLYLWTLVAQRLFPGRDFS